MLRLVNIRSSFCYQNLRNVVARWRGSRKAKLLDANTPPLLLERLRQLRLDPEYVAVAQPNTLRSLSVSCRECAHKKVCAADLAAGNSAAGMDTYCANGEIIDNLVVMRAKR